MIYRATWPDGREIIIRGADPEHARLNAYLWRINTDPDYLPSTPPVPAIDFLASRGKAEVLAIGWEQPKENP